MNVRRFATRLTVSTLAALAVASMMSLQGEAQSRHVHATAQTQSTFLTTVRQATERFKDVAVAEGEGYGLQFGCVSGADSGAMGLHYVNFPLVLDGELDPTHPEIVIYEPTANGSVRMIGADYLVLADAWHATHEGTPQLGGQLLHYFEAPNRFGLDPFYTLHVWAWKDNPTGMFVNWHSDVSCAAFSGQNP
jgi:hypothetical protein